MAYLKDGWIYESPTINGSDTTVVRTNGSNGRQQIYLNGPHSSVVTTYPDGVGGRVVVDTQGKEKAIKQARKAVQTMTSDNFNKVPTFREIASDVWDGIKSAIGVKQEGGSITNPSDSGNFLQYLGNNRAVLAGARLSSPAVMDIKQTVLVDPEQAAKKAKQYAGDEAVNIAASLVGPALESEFLAEEALAKAKLVGAEQSARFAQDWDLLKLAESWGGRAYKEAYTAAAKAGASISEAAAKGREAYKVAFDAIKAGQVESAPVWMYVDKFNRYNKEIEAAAKAAKSVNPAIFGATTITHTMPAVDVKQAGGSISYFNYLK